MDDHDRLIDLRRRFLEFVKSNRSERASDNLRFQQFATKDLLNEVDRRLSSAIFKVEQEIGVDRATDEGATRERARSRSLFFAVVATFMSAGALVVAFVIHK